MEQDRKAVNMPEPLWGDDEAGAFLLLHPKTVQRLARAGELPAFRIGKFWRYRGSELEKWVQEHRN